MRYMVMLALLMLSTAAWAPHACSPNPRPSFVNFHFIGSYNIEKIPCDNYYCNKPCHNTLYGTECNMTIQACHGEVVVSELNSGILPGKTINISVEDRPLVITLYQGISLNYDEGSDYAKEGHADIFLIAFGLYEIIPLAILLLAVIVEALLLRKYLNKPKPIKKT